MKKVLLVNARRKKCMSRHDPHLGLGMLAGSLKRYGCEVLVADYQLRWFAPPIEEFIDTFKPDVFGITLYTANIQEAEKLIKIAAGFNLPVMTGGPHATLYSEDLLGWRDIDYIIKGEAENIISGLVAEAKKQDKPQVLECKPFDISELVFPDFSCFFEYENITHYPWLVSRGCPYNCIFCSVHSITSRSWRPRKLKSCIEELTQAKNKFPKLETIALFDDSLPNRQYLIDLLNLYIAERINIPLTVVNIRADMIDEEILVLLKKCGCPSINIGVEHGDPDVFNNLDKGETLEDIKRAAGLIKKSGIPLYCCFIIGLPYDSLRKTKKSIQFALDLKADYVIWNSLVPYKGTKVREYFRSNPDAEIFNEINRTSWVDMDFMCEPPCIETKDFTRSERKKAYLMAILSTGHPALDWNSIPRLLIYAVRYSLYYEFILWFLRRVKDSRLGYLSRLFFKKRGDEISVN